MEHERSKMRAAYSSLATMAENGCGMASCARVAALQRVLTMVSMALLVVMTATCAQAQVPAPAQPVASSPQPLMVPPQVVQQTRQLLEWLGLLALLDQAPAALAVSLDAEAKFQQVPRADLRAVERALEPQLQPAQLQKALIQYVAERYQPATFKRAEELLQQPLAKRARFFDLAMTQTNAVQGLKSYRAQLQAAPQPARRAVIQELDAATATSLSAAILQTAVAERVRRNVESAVESAAKPVPKSAEEGTTEIATSSASETQARASTSTQEFVERQRFLAPLTEDYLLYAYRYLKDDELIALRDLMRDTELQWLLDVSRQGLIAVLKTPDAS